MKIYTKTGDLGMTSTVTGQRISKSNLRIKANGQVDELNSIIGIASSMIDYGKVKEMLFRVQNELFDLGADISNNSTRNNIQYLLKDKSIKKLEDEIDQLSEELSELKNFILPGGSPEGAYLHLARVVCRRAERDVVALHIVENLNPEIIMYLNRLSDWLFTVARYVNKLKNSPEIKYQKDR